MAWVKSHNEVSLPPNPDGGKLCFQQCTFHWDAENASDGYRFIWRRPNGNLVAARGQAFIPNKHDLETLTQKATEEGWFV